MTVTMLEAQRRVSRKAFFSLDRLGETIEYNGKQIVALAYPGATLSRTDWNDAATSIENANLADLAVFGICDDPTDENGIDKPPTEGDEIVYNGETYYASQQIEHDVAGSHYVVFATKNHRAWGR